MPGAIRRTTSDPRSITGTDPASIADATMLAAGGTTTVVTMPTRTPTGATTAMTGAEARIATRSARVSSPATTTATTAAAGADLSGRNPIKIATIALKNIVPILLPRPPISTLTAIL